MANPEKHKKNLAEEWLEAEDSTVPTHTRSTHVLGAYIKIPKPVPKKIRQGGAEKAPPKVDVSMLREPGAPPKAAKPSPLASWEHQRRVGRLPKLRAPYQYKSR